MQSAPAEGGGAEEGSSHGHDISTVVPAEGGGAEEGSSHGHDISTVVPAEGGGAEEGSSHGQDISTVAPAEGGGAEEGSSHGHDISTVVPAEGGGAEEGSSHGHDISTVVPAEGGGAEEGSSHGHEISTVELPLLSDKESLDILASYCKPDCSDLPGDITILGEFYASIRRTRLDGNSFLRSVIFSILEHLLETQDRVETDRIKSNFDAHWNTLNFSYHVIKRTQYFYESHPQIWLSSVHYYRFKSNVDECTLELDFLIRCIRALVEPFIELLNGVIQGTQTSISAEELLRRCRSEKDSNLVVKLFRCIIAAQIIIWGPDYENFLGVTIEPFFDASIRKHCEQNVDPMGKESLPLHIAALADALGVPIRVERLSRPVARNYHDYIPSSFPEGNPVEPYVKILYCGLEYYDIPHYAILYPM